MLSCKSAQVCWSLIREEYHEIITVSVEIKQASFYQIKMEKALNHKEKSEEQQLDSRPIKNESAG